jgi:hypothetical protein
MEREESPKANVETKHTHTQKKKKKNPEAITRGQPESRGGKQESLEQKKVPSKGPRYSAAQVALLTGVQQ